MNGTPVTEALAADRAAWFRGLFADQDRFRAWYDEALPVVYGFVFARCAGDASLAVDITQEAFVAAVRDRERFIGDADPVTWVCAIARNKLVDHFRRAERERRRHLTLVADARAVDVRPIDEFDDREAVLRVLEQLPESHRIVLVLHYLDGLPVREIADVVGRSESATESLLTRARQGFRRHLKGGETRAS